MQDIRIAAVSMNGRLGEPEAVLSEIADWTAKAVAEGAELIFFPELVVHGHCTPNTYELAEAVPDGPSTQRLCQIAREYNVVLSAGLSEKENNLVFNTQIVAGPEGYIGKQRKIHPSRDEVLFYKGGREMPVFDIGKCKIGIQICYDKLFPEISRILCLRGAEVLLMPHAARRLMWDETQESQTAARRDLAEYERKMIPARAIEKLLLRRAHRPSRPRRLRRCLPQRQPRATSPSRWRHDRRPVREDHRRDPRPAHRARNDRGDARSRSHQRRTLPTQLHAEKHAARNCSES